MKKVVFEQIGNIIITIILVIATFQTVTTSKFDATYENFNVELNFNYMWLLFIASIILFSLCRFFYANKIGINDGYNKKDGELSAQDEREKLVGSEAAKVTYRALTYFLAIVLVLFIFTNGFIASSIILRIAFIVAIGSCLIFTFLTYLIAWIIFDNKI